METAAKYRALNQEYTKFSKAAGLRLQREWANIQEFGPKEAREAEKALAKTRNDDIMTMEGRLLNQEGFDAEIPDQYLNDFSEFEPLVMSSTEQSVFH